MDTTKIIVALLGAGGLFTAIFAFLKWYLPWRLSRKNKRGALQGLESLNTIYQVLHDVIKNTNATRIIIFAGHNSGKIPRAGSPYYTSAIHWRSEGEEAGKDVIDISSYRNIAVDGFYISILLKCYDRGFIKLSTESMEECQLKKYYLAEGVTEAYIYFLGFVEANFMYMCIANRGTPFTDVNTAVMGLAASRVANEINKG